MIDAISSTQLPQHQRTERDQALWSAAQKLEATFLAEMLKSSGLGEVNDSFGGGIGEEQFASFLRGAQADNMVQAGGIGLAESIFQSLKETDRGTV